MRVRRKLYSSIDGFVSTRRFYAVSIKTVYLLITGKTVVVNLGEPVRRTIHEPILNGVRILNVDV